MTDPQFAGDFAKAINKESKELHLQLIKDPTYQKSVGEIMKSPEMMKMFLDLTKTPDYRKQSMTIMQEAMQNPLFRMEVLTLLKSVVQDELQPKVEKKRMQGKAKAAGRKKRRRWRKSRKAATIPVQDLVRNSNKALPQEWGRPYFFTCASRNVTYCSYLAISLSAMSANNIPVAVSAL
ncbi:spore germination lipoprotein GerD [Paenibacillus rhizoplanae]